METARRAVRRGALAVELLLALALGLFVMVAFVGAAVGVLRATAALWSRAEALEVVRTVWVVLDEELRPGLFGRDWQLNETGDVVSLRAFRGVARVCPDGEGEEGAARTVAVRGRRAADPSRDSVLVLGSDGGWRAFVLDRVDPASGCAPDPGEVVQRWSWDQDGAPSPVLLRYFERGEYHLAEGALRYRRGTSGRQPLTPERLAVSSGFRPVPGGIEVELTFRGENGMEGGASFVWDIIPEGP